ncbi:MAG TPA: 7TM domain-containing protein [Candidatus Dojkabacteria bacterium]|nr:7TM domain-containing protein [Candidatus Dojkabacteria bacterium]
MDYTPFTKWVLDNGLSERTLELLVGIAIVATIVSLARYLFGSKSFGIYAPVILAVAFTYTGLRYGLVITAVVITSSLLSYLILSKIRMHYISRMAINYCLIIMSLIIFFIIVHKYNLGLPNMSLIQPLAIISIIGLSDFFAKQQIKKGFKTSILVLGSTLVIASIGWFIITREAISTFMINNLWLIPALIVINILIGQFSGLRFKDIVRFRTIIQDEENVKK